MTAPVEMEWSADEFAKVACDPKSMAFFMAVLRLDRPELTQRTRWWLLRTLQP